MKTRDIAWGLCATLAACSASREAPPAGTNQVKWTATSGSVTPAPDSGFVVDVAVRAAIVDGWHIYSVGQKEGGPVPLSVKVNPSPPYSVAGDVTGPQPEVSDDPNFGIETETYSREAVIKVPVRVSASAGADLPPLELKVRSQACSDRVCLPAQTTTLVVNPKPPKS